MLRTSLGPVVGKVVERRGGAGLGVFFELRTEHQENRTRVSYMVQ